MLSFGDIADAKEDQAWELLEATDGGRGAVEYPVRVTRFANVSSIDLFFVRPASVLRAGESETD